MEHWDQTFRTLWCFYGAIYLGFIFSVLDFSYSQYFRDIYHLESEVLETTHGVKFCMETLN